MSGRSGEARRPRGGKQRCQVDMVFEVLGEAVERRLDGRIV
jgi:hypothetical protein